MKLKREHVSQEWDEGRVEDGGDGYWIALKPGWKWDGDSVGAVHTIHEGTKAEAWAEGVMPCKCDDCCPKQGVDVQRKYFRAGADDVSDRDTQTGRKD